MKIRNVNNSTRTLNSYQFGWLMRELQLDFTWTGSPTQNCIRRHHVQH